MERKLLDYLPAVLRPYREFIGLTDGQQWLLEALWEAADRVFQNQFLDTMDHYGLSRWEAILKLTPKGTDSLETRRFRIKVRLNERLPFTLRLLRQRLEDLCGADGAQVRLSDYLLYVRVGLAVKNSFEDVRELLDRIVPANLTLDVSLAYNTHRLLGRLWHEELAELTHEQIRSEVLPRRNEHGQLHGYTHNTLSGRTAYKLRREALERA